jgi:hypothetical protein
MAKRAVPGWLVDARFWMIIFVVGFWPAVLLGKYIGLAILLLVVVGGSFLANRSARAGADAQHGTRLGQ